LGSGFLGFKPDNNMRTRHSVKLIDLGGVFRIGDSQSTIFGTPGYQAPEVADTGPTVASALYTVARTLSILCSDFTGFQDMYRFSFPDQESVPLYAECDSLYKFLERA